MPFLTLIISLLHQQLSEFARGPGVAMEQSDVLAVANLFRLSMSCVKIHCLLASYKTETYEGDSNF